MLNLSLELSDGWRITYPRATVGMLAMQSVTNSAPSPELQARLHAIEASLKARYSGRSRRDLQSLPHLQPYVRHYRAFGKTYHVLLQLESVAFRGRPLAAPGSLVAAMFAVEVDTGLLTAGHDLHAVSPPLRAELGRLGERYTGLDGTAIEVKPGDMTIRDREGIISSVLYGPDQRTRLLPESRSVLFTTYSPDGVGEEDLASHLQRLDELVRIDSPQASTLLLALGRPSEAR